MGSGLWDVPRAPVSTPTPLTSKQGRTLRRVHRSPLHDNPLSGGPLSLNEMGTLSPLYSAPTVRLPSSSP